jgi:hypothetical protein
MSDYSNDLTILKHNGQPVNEKDGSIDLTYTIATQGGPITNASFTYGNQSGTPPTQGPYTVTFTGPDTSGNYNGTTSMAPPANQPLNIPQMGQFKSGALVFNPTATPIVLTGSFSSEATAPGADDVTWSASGADKKAQARSGAGY